MRPSGDRPDDPYPSPARRSPPHILDVMPCIDHESEVAVRFLRFALIAAALLSFGTVGALAQYTTADTLKAVVPGLVYKEFSRIMPTSNNSWRVTDPNAGAAGAQQFLPNPVLPMTISDLQGAIKAVAVIDCWGGHIGTTNKRLRFNGNAWRSIPDIQGTPGNPACYMHQYTAYVPIPLSHLIEGSNDLEGTSGGQVCFSFNWGQWGWYGITVRVFYDPSQKTPPSGAITSPASGAILGENPVFSATASSSAGISRIEYVGYYDNYDVDGDGVYHDWQQSYFRRRNDSTMVVRNHIGTTTSAPYNVTWNTQWIPDQAVSGIQAVARIRDGGGLFYVTERVTGLSLSRPNVNVVLYKATNVPQRYWVRAGATRSSNFVIPGAHDLGAALSATMHVATWNGIDGQAEPGQNHWTRVNGWTTPNFGQDHYYSYDLVSLPLDVPLNGTNTVSFYSGSTHHGIEILWPGPGVMVRYEDLDQLPAYVITHPVDAVVATGLTATFSVTAGGTEPLTYQWQRDGQDIFGATDPSYTTPPVTMDNDGERFRCRVTNPIDVAWSEEATLTVVPPGQRVADGQLVLYTFAEGGGSTVHDVSGHGAPANLQIASTAAVTWLDGALSVDTPTVIATAAAATKVIDAVMASHALTVEAWVKPANTTQNGPARIVTISGGLLARNLTLGQGVFGAASNVYDARLRTTTTDQNGTPSLTTPTGDLTTALTHVAYTRSAAGVARIFINGTERAAGTVGGDLSNWDESFRLGLANELTGDRPWLGELHLVAMYNRALPEADILQNLAAGPNPAEAPTAVPTLPGEFALGANYPNPFNPQTVIAFELPTAATVSLRVYDLAGRLVATLVEGAAVAGTHTATWTGRGDDGLPVGSGVYLYRLTAEGAGGRLFTQTRRLTLLK